MSALSMSKCSICMETIDSNALIAEEKPQTLDCRHTYHTECIDALKARHLSCPKCPERSTEHFSEEEQVFDLEMPEVEPSVLLAEARNSVLEQRQVRKLADEAQGQMTKTAQECHDIGAAFLGSSSRPKRWFYVQH